MAVVSSPEPTRDALNAYGPIGRSGWMDVDWHDHLRWVDVDGDLVNLVDLGAAPGRPTVVFVHGLGGSWQNWLENLLPFATDHRVIAVDLPGFGASPLPREQITIPRYAALLDRLFGLLDIDAAAVVGNSMGGLIAAELALRHPHRVERLVLVSAAGLTPADRYNPHVFATFKRLERGLQHVSSHAATRAEDLARRKRLRRAALSVVAAAPELLPCALVAEQIKGAGKPGFMPASEALLTYPIRDRVAEVACPTLVVWGTRDRLVPVKDASEYEALIPDARKVVYKRTGHVPQLERPARFNTDLRAFLEEQPGEREPAGPELR
ncbi:MAG: alpha/beta fold hydrolase [Solirubrobacteraceae bacterium]